MTSSHITGTPMTPAQYADQWRVASASLLKNGHYTWMLAELQSATRILEVGCGAGGGTYALAQSGKRVTAVDINEHAVAHARQYLADQGISVEIRSPSELSGLGESDAQVCLVVGDICNPELAAALPTGMFDTLVCWLMGASPHTISVSTGKPLEALIEADAAAHRHRVQRLCYELGRRILQPGTAVHIVERFGISSWNDRGYFKEQIANAQRELAGEGYRIQAHNVSLRQVDSIGFDTSKIQYNHDERAPVRVLASIRSVRTAEG